MIVIWWWGDLGSSRQTWPEREMWRWLWVDLEMSLDRVWDENWEWFWDDGGLMVGWWVENEIIHILGYRLSSSLGPSVSGKFFFGWCVTLSIILESPQSILPVFGYGMGRFDRLWGIVERWGVGSLGGISIWEPSTGVVGSYLLEGSTLIHWGNYLIVK